MGASGVKRRLDLLAHGRVPLALELDAQRVDVALDRTGIALDDLVAGILIQPFGHVINAPDPVGDAGR